MRTFELNGKKIDIMKEFVDEKYGRVWKAYYGDKKVYIVEGEFVESQEIIDDLDNKYGRPVSERDIVF